MTKNPKSRFLSHPATTWGLILLTVLFSFRVYAFHSFEWVQRLGNIGCFLSGAGLLFLALQYMAQNDAMDMAQKSENRDQIKLIEQARSSIYQLNSNNLQLLINQPDLLPYFTSSAELPDMNEPKYLAIMATAELITDSFELIYNASKSLEQISREPWLKYMKKMRNNSKAIQLHIAMNQSHYEQNFVRAIQGH